jgi:hypothetical protein
MFSHLQTTAPLGAALLLSALLALGGTAAHAVTVVIPDPSPNQEIYYGAGDASVTFDGVVFTQSAALGNPGLFDVGVLFSGSPAVLSSGGESTGLANILITLPVFTHDFTLNYGTFHGSDVTFTLGLPNYTSFTQHSDVDNNYSTPDLLGAGSSLGFKTILLTTTDAVFNINNIEYDASAPEPATWSLMLVGLAGLGATLRSRRRITAHSA